jgi:Domain of unknown function (DUF1707)/Domain of unknown function (DUF4190)
MHAGSSLKDEATLRLGPEARMTLDPRQAAVVNNYGYLRAATADRERAVDVLKAGFAEGRLSKQEYDERVSRVYASRTYADLAVLTGDLPVGPLATMVPPALPPGAPWPGWSVYARPPYYGGPARRRINRTAIAAFLCAFIPGPLSIAGIALGIDAHAQIKRRAEAGAGLADAAIVIGIITTLALALLWSLLL